MSTEDTCDRFELDLAALAAGELESSRSMEIQKHLLSCASCRAMLQELEAQQVMLGELEDPPGFEQAVAEVHDRVMARIAVPHHRWRPRLYWAAAACLMTLLVAGWRIAHVHRGIPKQHAEQALLTPQTPTTALPVQMEAVPSAKASRPHRRPSPATPYDPVRAVRRILESSTSTESQTVLIQQSPKVVIYWVIPAQGGIS